MRRLPVAPRLPSSWGAIPRSSAPQGTGVAVYFAGFPEIGTDEFSRALYRAQGIVEKKSTMPILASVLLEATEEGRLRVSAFDLEIGVTGTHPCEVHKAGAVALKHKELYDIIRALPEKVVVMRREANNRVKLTSGAAEFNIVGQPAEDYPPFPRAEKVDFFQVEPAALLEMIEKTQFAISADETRHNLNGVYFETSEGNDVRMVATDGHRLSLVQRSLDGQFNLKRGVIVPRKGLLELRRLLSEDQTGHCELGFTDTSGVFRRGDVTMVMRLIDGTFPDYMQVIPKEADRTITVDRPRLLVADPAQPPRTTAGFSIGMSPAAIRRRASGRGLRPGKRGRTGWRAAVPRPGAAAWAGKLSRSVF